MRGKAQPDGCPALQIIETPFLLFATCGPKYTCNAAFRLTSCCSGKISAMANIKLQNCEIEFYYLHDMDTPGGQNFEGRKFKFQTRKCFRLEVRGGGVTQCNTDPAPL